MPRHIGVVVAATAAIAAPSPAVLAQTPERNEVQSVQTESRIHLGCRSRLAGLWQRLAQRRSAEFWRGLGASIIDRATPGIPLFEPGSGRAVYAGVRARW